MSNGTAQAVFDWITAHPYKTALHVVNGVIMLTPAAATVPLLSAMGLGTAGPIAGSAASNVMSFFSVVPAGGWFATAQSAAMGGYGASAAAGAAQLSAAFTSSIAFLSNSTIRGW